MSGKEDYDSDAPEEFTQEQTIAKHDEISKAQKDSKARVIREKKEKRKQQQAQRATQQSSVRNEHVEDVEELEENPEAERSRANQGFLPKHVVEKLAAREKLDQSPPSDSEDDEDEEAKSLTSGKRKSKKRKSAGAGAFLLGDIPPPECLKNSLEFLKKRKMQVARSSSVLNNSNQALRLVSAMFPQRR
ncbi:PREDICTED: uncharacterized protein LOC104819832 [Tarenaya hassleriana]|uniref:uncharacterized protein LOC104819832 n=1 Tax=Tarenaya hassleriana TaxID=28532 RepID=UPI00053C1556|nr:PREDICTED: uncharacterized protein LOC104819832 [Tarenaya hassleriana]